MNGADPWATSGKVAEQAAQQAPKLDAQQAITAAVAAVPGSAQEVRLESRGGKRAYEVTVLPKGSSSRVRVEVDAVTGQVARSEQLKAQSASGRENDEDEDEQGRR